MSAASLRVEAVERRYRGGGAFALAPTTLDVAPGTWTVLVGRSGAGKTTLLHLLAGLDRPDAGRVWMFGRDVTGDGEGALAEIRRRRLGVVYQQFHFIEHLSVWRNVTCRLVPEGVPARERRERAAAALAELDVADTLDRAPRALSGGEQQRVALARALIAGPDVLIADEPTSNVDADTGAMIVERLRALHAGGAALVVATHDPAVIAAADRTLRMDAGRIVA